MTEQKNTLPDVPTWYTPDEMWYYLIGFNYSGEIADELAQKWANDLQNAFKKGYEKGYVEKHTTESPIVK